MINHFHYFPTKITIFNYIIQSMMMENIKGKPVADFAVDRPGKEGDALMRVCGGNGQVCGPQDVVAVVIQGNKQQLDNVIEENGVMEVTLRSGIVHVIKIFYSH